MDFLGLGWGEILMIIIVALIIWGPGRITEIARSLGKTVRAFRKAASDMTAEVTRELDEETKNRSLPPETNSDNPRESSDVTKPEAGATGATTPLT